jgi:hypothetical protein
MHVEESELRMQKKRQDQKSIPQRKLEHAQMEDYLAKMAREERGENVLEEYKLMMEQIVSAI